MTSIEVKNAHNHQQVKTVYTYSFTMYIVFSVFVMRVINNVLVVMSGHLLPNVTNTILHFRVFLGVTFFGRLKKEVLVLCCYIVIHTYHTAEPSTPFVYSNAQKCHALYKK